MKLSIYGETDIGFTRRRNEDAIGWYHSAGGDRVVAVLADGIGGHEGGDIASQMAVDVCIARLTPLIEQQGLNDSDLSDSDISDSDIIGALTSAIVDANKQIRALKTDKEKTLRMGTTLLIVCVVNNHVYIANIGDSRCYRVNVDSAIQVTRDDTVAQAMVDDGSIAESEVSNVPFRNVLTKALGTESEVAADVQTLVMKADDTILLCSDGLTGAVSADQWPSLIASQKSIRQQVGCLIDESLTNKVNDNVSVILIRQSQ